MTTYRLISQMNHVLQSMDGILTKAQEYAQAQNLELEGLLGSQFAPDMFPFWRQVQMSIYYVQGTAASLSGKEPLDFGQDAPSFEQFHAQIKQVNEYIQGFSEQDFANAAEQKVFLPWLPGHYVFGLDYLHQLALPNFYFHATTAYDLLRRLGVELGKQDFLGPVNIHKAEE